MKNRNLILRYFGLLVLITGVIFNIRMFIIEAWPTSLFFIICLIGIIQVCFSYYKQIKIAWQIFWCLIPFILGYAYFQINAPSKDSVSVQIINWGNLGINGRSQNFYVDIPNNSFFNRQNKNGI